MITGSDRGHGGFMPHLRGCYLALCHIRMEVAGSLNFKEDAHIFMLYEIFHF